MSYPNPGPPQQPYGQQPQQPYGYGPPQQPGPPQPAQGMSTGAKVGIGCAGAFALIIILAIIGSLVGSDDDSKTPAASSSSSAPAAEETKATSKPKQPAKPAPIAVKAARTKYVPSVLADGSPHTSVKVTVTNNSKETISINPLYFSITDTNGTRHAAQLAVDENQMETTDLAPGENITGVITGKGSFKAKVVTYKDGFIGDTVRANVK